MRLSHSGVYRNSINSIDMQYETVLRCNNVVYVTKRLISGKTLENNITLAPLAFQTKCPLRNKSPNNFYSKKTVTAIHATRPSIRNFPTQFENKNDLEATPAHTTDRHDCFSDPE